MGLPRKILATVFATAPLLVAGACQRPAAAPESTTASLSASDILDRCISVYRRLTSYSAVGTMRDDRGGKSPPVAIKWEYERPNRMRLALDNSEALVVGDGWWTLDAPGGGWRRHHQFTRTPIITAAHLLSRGVPFLTPMLLTKPDRALSVDSQGGMGAWRLEGADWSGGRPCYVLRRPQQVRDGQGVLRIWIDQDNFVMRSWAISVPGLDGQDESIAGCTFDVVSVDSAISPERFQLSDRTNMGLPGGRAK
jgi:outer membrane lipoprotein-sorting protein